jgi:hypothetical protein
MPRTVARVALVLLALSAGLAFGGGVAAPDARSTHSSAAVATQFRDDVHAIAAAPARAADWAVGHGRGSDAGERLGALLLGAVLLLVARAWRRTSRAFARGDAALHALHTGIRGPPAFV